MNNKAAITSTVGYMCLALTGWMLSISNAGWFEAAHGHATAMMFPLSLILLVIGILAFTNERALDAVIFFGGAGLFWSGHEYLLAPTSIGGAVDPAHYAGWYWCVWAVFYFYVWLGALQSGLIRMLFLLGLWWTLLALAIGEWTGVHGITLLGGYLGLATAILAAIVSAQAVIGHGFTLRSAARQASSQAA